MMTGLEIREKIESSVEKRTIDKIVKTQATDNNNDFILSLFEFDSHEFAADLKEKLTLEEVNEQATFEENIKFDDSDEMTMVTDENAEDSRAAEPVPVEEEAEKQVAQVVSVVSADEIRPEVIDYIKDELVAKMQEEKLNIVQEFIHGKAVSQEEFSKLQLWSCFPIIGIPIYLFFLVVLSVNKRQKYNPTLVNFARSQLKTFWIYAIAHLSVIFVALASMTSLVNIIQRGLAA